MEGRKEGGRKQMNLWLTLFHKDVGAKEVAPVWLQFLDFSYHIIFVWDDSVLTGVIWKFPWLNQKHRSSCHSQAVYKFFWFIFKSKELWNERGIELPASKEVLCNSFTFLKSECFAIAQKLLTLFLEDRVFYQLLCLLYILK